MMIGMVGLVAQRARERHAVLGLELQIEHDEIHHLLGEHRLHRLAVGHRGDAQLVLAEVIDDQLPDGGVVVHRKDMRLGRLGGCLELRSHDRLASHDRGSVGAHPTRPLQV